jgi:D-serine deaminase-like pyridoxal phosphate-dependent protein
MAYAGIRDILIANQIVSAKKIARLVNLARQADIKVAVDNPQNVRAIGSVAQAANIEVGVLIELNTGMNRAGVQPGQAAVDLAQMICDTPGVRFLGLMAWEGHTLSQRESEAKLNAVHSAVERLIQTVELCKRAGIPVEIVSGGGSGTYQITPFIDGITEIQAGGAIFNDVAYQNWDVQTKPALFVRATVTSRPIPERIILDVGFKSLPAWISKPVPLGIDHVKDVGMSAEHGIVTLEQPNNTLQIGEMVDFMVGYTDATLFLHDRLYGIRHDEVEVVWDIQARGKLR